MIVQLSTVTLFGNTVQPKTPLSKHNWDFCDYFLSGDNAYTLNERLFAVPIHGPETPCSVCYTKRESEYETEGSYVR